MSANTKTLKMYARAIAVLISEIVKMFILQFCKLYNKPENPEFYSSNAKFLEKILNVSPKLSEPYIPTRIWGYSGHIQTIIESTKLFPCPVLNGERFSFVTSDGATITYDFYRPQRSQIKNETNITFAVLPGAFGSSKTSNIRRLVNQAQINGYMAAVLNHVGVLKNIPITSPRIFDFGNTSDYDGMIRHLVARNPTTRIICIGYSMGANIITKYFIHTK